MRGLLFLLLPLTLTAQSLTLTWTDNSDNEDGFIIERSLDGINFAEIGRVGVDVETYTDTAITYDIDYWYRVAAYNAAGISGFTNIAVGQDSGAVLDPGDIYKHRAKRKALVRRRMLL